jgi:transposase
LWHRDQRTLDPERLVFLDEMGVSTDMVPRRGWALKGKRLKAYAPHGHWKTTTLVMGLRCDRLIAPMVIPCPMNGAIFAQYTKDILAKELRPGDIVVMDNLSSHKSDAVREIIEQAGAELLFLPPYSPDLNPIEQVFSKLKRALRKSAKRNIEALWDEIGRLIGPDHFPPKECANYLRASGYRPV